MSNVAVSPFSPGTQGLPDSSGSGPVDQSVLTGTTHWLVWGRSALAALLVAVLLGLGISNIAQRARLQPVEDGVLWGARAEGVTAVEVAPESAGATAGIQRGDVLLAVDGQPVQAPRDVVEYQRGVGRGQLTYTLVRLGDQKVLEISLAPVPLPGSQYYVLATVGLFTLLVGASVRLRRPRDQATLHFFWLCVAFFGMFTFSFNGPLNRLDWVFYWGDAIATVMLPPLLLHFTVGFPQRPSALDRSRGSLVLLPIYLPALLIATGRIVAVSRGATDGPQFSRTLGLLDGAELLYLFTCVVAAILVLARASGEIESLTGRRQLRWILCGTVLGLGPFALGYALPWALGADPPFGLQLTAIPLGLVPLTFASAIVRYRLRDVEVIVKRGLGYAAFLGATAALYLALFKTVGFVFDNENDAHNWVVAFLATIVVVLLAQPVKSAVQTALDRAFYRDRYDYRRALVAFARDLNSDLDIIRLSRRLVDRIVETLVLERMALMLTDERQGTFRAVDEYGFAELVPALQRGSSFTTRLDDGHIVALDGSDPIAVARFSAEEVEFWRDQGISCFVPCVFEGTAIAVMALGRDETFNSEDLALLVAVAGQVATAIENGRLYRQLHLKAEELGRLREFNENILESLDDGLIVFDADERVVRWNHALEHFYGIRQADALGRTLEELFDSSFVDALRAARRENPLGATLFKVPLNARKPRDADGATASDPRLLVNATAVPLRSGPNPEAVAGTILLLEDLTDRVRLEEQLQISEKMASIGLLAAGVAHEVNTPLTGISSFTQMLLEGADPADPRTILLEKIERQTFRAAKIVNGLLTLARPGTVGSERTTVDLNDVITDVFSLLEHQFTASKIKVRRELLPDPVRVLGIEHQLQQVFLNLFLNARDAMPSGGWLTVTTRAEGGQFLAEVSDTGSGIPPDQLARIYDPFFTTKAIGRGTGLGLSISYGIVHEHGGSIRCDSSVGQGTRFTVMLPVAQAVARSAAQ